MQVNYKVKKDTDKFAYIYFIEISIMLVSIVQSISIIVYPGLDIASVLPKFQYIAEHTLSLPPFNIYFVLLLLGIEKTSIFMLCCALIVLCIRGVNIFGLYKRKKQSFIVTFLFSCSDLILSFIQLVLVVLNYSDNQINDKMIHLHIGTVIINLLLISFIKMLQKNLKKQL